MTTMTTPDKSRRAGPGKAGRPRLDPSTTGEGRVTWVYGDGQLDLLKAWAEEDGVDVASAMRAAVDEGTAQPFPEDLVEEELKARSVFNTGQRAGSPEGKVSPHYKWRPLPGQVAKLDARREPYAGKISRNAATRIAVRVVAKRRAGEA